MLARIINWLLVGITPTQVDGLLYIAIAVSSANMAVLTSDEVYKYVHPNVVFYSKWITILFNSLVTALKMFRSTAYADTVKGRERGKLQQQPENQ